MALHRLRNSPRSGFSSSLYHHHHTSHPSVFPLRPLHANRPTALSSFPPPPPPPRPPSPPTSRSWGEEMVGPSTTARVNGSRVDDQYFSALVSAGEPLIPISDELYAENLQFQEVLASSLNINTGNSIDDEAHHRHLPLRYSQATSSTRKPLTCLATSILEVGQSSSSSLTIDCRICAESKAPSEMFHSKSCHHLFCRECIGRHIEAKVGENTCVVLCPDTDCGGILDPADCRGLVGEPGFERWSRALCESTLLGRRRFYCPYKDCSALYLIDDDDEGEEEITQAECGSCRRLFCAKCCVPWHAGMACEKYQSLGTGERGREDLMLMELAMSNQWQRCPSCGFFVEKITGCLHLVCRCKFEFCYGCGEEWSKRHETCHT